MNQDEIAARVAILDLTGRFAEAADNKDADAYAALFAPDARFEPGPIPMMQGREAVREFIRGLPPDVPRTWHQMTSSRIDYLGEGRAQGCVYYLALSETGIDHWGRYEDEYREVDGRWLFQVRLCRIESFAPGSLMERMLKNSE